jgi:hypothetical protein
MAKEKDKRLGYSNVGKKLRDTSFRTTGLDKWSELISKSSGWSENRLLKAGYFKSGHKGEFNPGKEYCKILDESDISDIRFSEADRTLLQKHYIYTGDAATKHDPEFKNPSEGQRRMLRHDAKVFYEIARYLISPPEAVALLWKQLPPRHAMENPEVRNDRHLVIVIFRNISFVY